MAEPLHLAFSPRTMDDPFHVGRESAFDEDAACDPYPPGEELPTHEQCDGCGNGTYVVEPNGKSARCIDCGAVYPFTRYPADDIVW